MRLALSLSVLRSLSASRLNSKKNPSSAIFLDASDLLSAPIKLSGGCEMRTISPSLAKGNARGLRKTNRRWGRSLSST